MIDWEKGTKAEHELASKIAKRAVKEIPDNIDIQHISMSIMAAHTHSCPLKLQSLLDADLGNFLHDVFGINQHINHDTGELMSCFVPRYAE